MAEAFIFDTIDRADSKNYYSENNHSTKWNIKLENIGVMLSGQNGQVWIIDHNSIVDRAFTTTVRL